MDEEKPQVNFYKLDFSKPYSVASEDDNVVKNCTLTDGVVTSVVKRRIASSDRNDGYEVETFYKFTDDKMRQRKGSFKINCSFDPPFFEGQYLMVAFNETESFVLEKFTLTSEDAAKLRAVEAARSADDFDNLSNELEDDIDLSKPIKSSEGNFVYKLLAIILSVIVVLCLIPVGIFVIPGFFDGSSVVPNIIVGTITLLVPVLLIICIIILSCKYVKREKRVKSIIKSNPYFAWGRIFYSENTYNGAYKKRMLYCYIDKWGEKHTEEFHGAFSNASASPRDYVVIAYTADGRSVPIEDFTFLHPEDYGFDEEDDENGTEEE